MIKLIDKPNTQAPDSDFPFGNIKDKVGSNPGTPLNKLVYADMHQFFEKLMFEAGVTPNGLPESEYAGFQLMTALVRMFGKMRRAVYEIGGWDMDADASKIVSTEIVFTKVRGISFLIKNDSGDNVFPNGFTQSGFTSDVEAAAGGTDASGDLSIFMSRTPSGTFDSTDFNDVSVNRGFVIVDYEVDDY